MTDGAALRELISRERPALIVPEIEAIATATLIDIERAGLAKVIPTARAAWLTMNREGIRKLAAETLGLPTSPYRFADSLEELHAAIEGAADQPGIGYPCIIKPVMSSSGKGQSTVAEPAGVEASVTSTERSMPLARSATFRKLASRWMPSAMKSAIRRSSAS